MSQLRLAPSLPIGARTVFFLVVLAGHAVGVRAIATFNKFRTLPPRLRAEWEHFLSTVGGPEALKNSAARHVSAANVFCRQYRAAGCTWAEHHAIVDHSREPYAALFDSVAVPADGQMPLSRAARCERHRKPSAEQLLDLVRRSQPAVLTGLLDAWPALERWTDAYLVEQLGHVEVAMSVTDGGYDQAEPPEAWGLVANASLRGVVARPAHVPMRLRDALDAMHANHTTPTAAASGALSGYVEYLPIEMLTSQTTHPRDQRSAARILEDDLRPTPPGDVAKANDPWTSAAGGAAGDAEESGDAAGSNVATADAPPVLTSRGQREAGALAIAAFLVPRKHLLWLGGGGTVGSTHYDPYENLMAVLSGQKTFHLAPPEEGARLGAHTKMAEGSLRLEPASQPASQSASQPASELVSEPASHPVGTAGDAEAAARGGAYGEGRGDAGSAERGNASSFLGRHRVIRSPTSVGTPIDLHHYAAVSLSDPSTPPHGTERRRLAAVRGFECTAVAGEVLFTPSYWWHEVVSHAPGVDVAQAPAGDGGGDGGGGSRHSASRHASPPSGPLRERRSVIAMNWFYDGYYQRPFPNHSFQINPHYVLLNEQRPLDAPFPARAEPEEQSPPSAKDSSPSAEERSAASSRPAGGGGRFYSRLRSKRTAETKEDL